jgi:hypothetical protein
MQRISRISTEAIRGATDLVEMFHSLSDLEDQRLVPLLAAARNAVWAQRDMVELTLRLLVEATE